MSVTYAHYATGHNWLADNIDIPVAGPVCGYRSARAWRHTHNATMGRLMARTRDITAAAVVGLGLVVTACGSSADSNESTGEPSSAGASSTTAGASATTTAGGADLQSLIPAPAGSQREDGPDAIQEDGVHKHFLINGAPLEVMDAYRTALEGAGWTVTVERSGGDEGGGGATYTGTNGGAYGVFDGGGRGNTTDIDSCVWPSQPTNSQCGSRR